MPLFQHEGRFHYFAHVPKCGGSTVEAMLADRFGPLAFLDLSYYGRAAPDRWTRTSPQHATWADVTRLIPAPMIDRRFAVVRHPIDRFVSAFNHGARSGSVPSGMGPQEWLAQAADPMLPFRADHHLHPQSDLVPDDATVFRLEGGLGAVADWIDATFGVSGPQPQRENAAPHALANGFVQTSVTAGLRARLAAIYATDFARFGYDPATGGTAPLLVPNGKGRAIGARLRLKLWAKRAELQARRLETRAFRGAGQLQLRFKT